MKWVRWLKKQKGELNYGFVRFINNAVQNEKIIFKKVLLIYLTAISIILIYFYLVSADKEHGLFFEIFGNVVACMMFLFPSLVVWRKNPKWNIFLSILWGTVVVDLDHAPFALLNYAGVSGVGHGRTAYHSLFVEAIMIFTMLLSAKFLIGPRWWRYKTHAQFAALSMYSGAVANFFRDSFGNMDHILYPFLSQNTANELFDTVDVIYGGFMAAIFLFAISNAIVASYWKLRAIHGVDI